MRFFGYVDFKVADRRITELFCRNNELTERLKAYGCTIKNHESINGYSPEKVNYYAGVLDKFEDEVKQLKIELGEANKELRILRGKCSE